MASREEIEKVRQAIMRFHELLTMMRQNLEAGENAYRHLFANCSAEEMNSMKEKDLQWKVAEEIVDDVSPLSNAAIRLRFNTRNLERDFEELYDIIMTEHEA